MSKFLLDISLEFRQTLDNVNEKKKSIFCKV